MLRSPRMILVPPSYPIRRGGAGTALYARVSIVGDPSRDQGTRATPCAVGEPWRHTTVGTRARACRCVLLL
jgi:hypothetical protein